jgi:hypothetical protein
MGQRGGPRARQMVKRKVRSLITYLCVWTDGEGRNPWWVSHPDLLFCFLLALAPAGCATVAPPAVPRPITVEIPIATPIYCQVPTLEPPILPIATLTADSPPADTVRSYAASVDVLKSAVRERDALLQGCAPPPATTATNISPNIEPAPPQPITAPAPPKPPASSSLPSRLVTYFGKLL